ncbi:MAG TPA: tetratricopeptide repeat protein, partial [Candidatus Marinimicrobia bacterium]|nr:tetratricopeptide repeat protein [Candidatus Neomarinimicrobiota bacterium]
MRVTTKVLNNLGYLAYSRDDYGKAHEYYIRSLNLYGDYFTNEDKVKILLNLGNVFSAYNDTASARVHYFKALELVEDHKENKALVFNNLGGYFAYQEHYDKG